MPLSILGALVVSSLRCESKVQRYKFRDGMEVKRGKPLLLFAYDRAENVARVCCGIFPVVDGLIEPVTTYHILEVSISKRVVRYP